MIGAFAWWKASQSLPSALAIIIGVGVSAIVGALAFLLAIRPLANASTLGKIVSTLGILIILQSAVTLRFGTEAQSTTGILPNGVVTVHSLRIPVSDLCLIGIALVLTAGMWALYRWTNFGLATSALAQSPVGLASLGYRADVIGCVNWSLGGALAGLSGILLASLGNLTPTLGTAILVPVLASAVVGGMSSFPLALLGALAIGTAQSVLGFYVSVPGIADVVPLAVVVVLLMVRGRGLPLRSFVTEKLPRVQGASLPLGWIAGVTIAVSLIVDLVLPIQWVLAVTTTCCAGLILLSVVVVTGFGGQISLAQFAIAGVGGLVAAHAVSAGIPLVVVLFISMAAVLPISIIVGLPASRSRGMALAIATLCLGQVLVSAILNNTSLIGGYNGIQLGKISILGLDLSPLTYPRRYSIFTMILLSLASIVVCNIRRGRIGRQLLAVRGNERASASLGMNVVATKLGAFAYGGMIAALGGTLFVLQNPVATFSTFDVFSSIQYVAWGVIGGVGYVAGTLLGAGFQQGSVGAQAINSIFGSGVYTWISLVGGVVLILTLVQSANGVIPQNIAYVQAIRRRLTRVSTPEVQQNLVTGKKTVEELQESGGAVHDLKELSHSQVATQTDNPQVRDHTLTVKELSVHLGGVRALDSVSFEIKSGEVLGVIGPNGAGKTTLIDAITGFVKINAGNVSLDAKEINGWGPQRRSRAGISRSFQSVELFDQLTVRENILASATRSRPFDWLKDLVWPGRVELSTPVKRVIRALSLEGSLDRRPDELPFSTRRSVALARSIAGHPVVVLLDEPAAGLSESERDQLSETIKWLASDLHIAVLLVEHDVALVSRVSDRVLALDQGSVVAIGEPDEVLANRRVLESYIGSEVDFSVQQDQ